MRDRTADLNTASVALSQLSYSPKSGTNFRVYRYWCQANQQAFNNLVRLGAYKKFSPIFFN